jgi:hypothetical protein
MQNDGPMLPQVAERSEASWYIPHIRNARLAPENESVPTASTRGRKTSQTAAPPPAAPNHADELTLDIEGQAVKCTRLGKVLYPAAKFTKGEVIEYYIRVAPYILPHLKDRPVTLKRYPDGVTGETYWEKDVPSFAPDWIETFPVPRRAGGPDIRYILIQNTATLAWASNAAALELHPFLTSRARDRESDFDRFRSRSRRRRRPPKVHRSCL